MRRPNWLKNPRPCQRLSEAALRHSCALRLMGIRFAATQSCTISGQILVKCFSEKAPMEALTGRFGAYRPLLIAAEV